MAEINALKLTHTKINDGITHGNRRTQKSKSDEFLKSAFLHPYFRKNDFELILLEKNESLEFF